MTNARKINVIAVGTRFVEGMKAHNALEAAAAIAFWFFLSLVPLLVLLGFLVGRIARARGMNDLLGPALDLVPGTAEDIIRVEVERLSRSSAGVAPVGVVGFLWTASSGLHNLMDVFEIAVKVERRRWWVQRLIALAWVIAGLVAACALAWTLVRIDHALHLHETAAAVVAPSLKPHAPVAAQGTHVAALKHRVHEALSTPAEQLLASALTLLAGTGFLAGFYRFAVEHPARVRRRVWPGAVTAVVLWLVVSWVFGLYAVSVSTYAAYYGSLAAVAVLLVWLYLTSLSLVVGAEVNAQLEGVRATRPRPSNSR
ncbi:MAG TPA: YhjD/YihY/BrkB family envelope integrity protein [Polyangiaceae bacterium]